MQLVALPLICVMPSLLKEGGPLAVGGFYGAVLLQLERMAQPRRVYGEIYKKYIPYKSPLLKGDAFVYENRGIQLNNVSLTRTPPSHIKCDTSL